MDFESIHERDQEAIVQFVLQEEREAVRKQRWT
jgi:c-di-GMP-binding flagellar brake protein YcgR